MTQLLFSVKRKNIIVSCQSYWSTFEQNAHNFKLGHYRKPDNLALRNQWKYDVGFGYYVTPNLLASVYYEEYRSLLSGLQNPRDVLVAANYLATPAIRMNASVQVGLSNGAPDYGLTGGVSIRF